MTDDADFDSLLHASTDAIRFRQRAIEKALKRHAGLTRAQARETVRKMSLHFTPFMFKATEGNDDDDTQR